MHSLHPMHLHYKKPNSNKLKYFIYTYCILLFKCIKISREV